MQSEAETIKRDWLRDIRHAYEILSSPVVKLASVHQMIGGSRAISGMSALDRHAQAALLLSYVARRSDPVCMAYWSVVAGRQTDQAQILINAVIATLPTGAQAVRPVIMLIDQYGGRHCGIRAIKREAGCGQSAAMDLQRRVYSALDEIHERAVRHL